MKKNVLKTDNNGFTLVEMIVVLVILAILAAILVPALLGYIDQAKKKQDILDAKNLLTAVQSEMAKQYAKADFSDNSLDCIFPTGTAGVEAIEGDKKIISSDFATNVYKLADVENEKPNLFVIGTGEYKAYVIGDSNKPVTKDVHKPFTVYFAIYRKTATSDIIYYDGNNWIEIPPLVDQGRVNANGARINGTTEANRNLLKVGNENIYLQYYVLSNSNGNKKWYQVYREDYKAKNNIR